MATPGDLEVMVDSIFTGNNKIDPSQLKEFLKLLSIRLSPPEEPVEVEPESESVDEEALQVSYLTELITQCELRLAKLAETPKSRIVIRNEGQKLQTIMDHLDCVTAKTCEMQCQISDLYAAYEKIKKMECEKKQHYQDMIDRLYKESINSDICQLRKMYFAVQNQANELAVKCKSLTSDIEEIKGRIGVLNAIPELEKKVNQLLEWRASLKEEFNLMTERYEHVKTVKAGKCEVKDLLEERVPYCHLKKYVQLTVFEMAKKEYIREFNELRELFCELQLCFSAKLVAMHKEVQMVLCQLASKRRLEKRKT